MIDVDAYMEISSLFRHRWDPAILAILHDRPHRFRELANRLEDEVDEHLDDNAVSRGLHRLTRANRVCATRTRVGRREVPVYTITAEGQVHLRTYDAFIETYLRIQAQSRDGTQPIEGAVPEH